MFTDNYMDLISIEPNRKPNDTQNFKIQLKIIYLKYHLYLVSEQLNILKKLIINRITRNSNYQDIFSNNLELSELHKLFI